MKKKILLVYPKIPPTYWSFKYALPFIGKKASIPPLGLLTVAAMLPLEWQVKLIDMNVAALTDEDIVNADMIFTSSMIVQKESLAEIGKRCNELGVTHVAGGPYPTSSWQKIENVDHFILNEAEATLPMFLNDCENGNPNHIYASVTKPDITVTPIPRFDLIDMNNYHTMPLQYSRGCPYNCEFCDIIEMFGHQMRTKTTQQMIREFDLLYSLGWRGSVFIVDDNFIGNKPTVKQLLLGIADWQREHNYPFDLFTEASINLADDRELLDLMSVAGFNMVFIGIETPDKETLLQTGKNQNLKGDLYESVRKIQAKGIEVAGGFIVGFDNDAPDIFERQIKFIQDSGIALAMVGLLTALPNTQLYRRLKKEGRLLEDSTGNNTHDLQLNFLPKMDLEIILSGYKHIIKRIYNPKEYFERCLIFMQNLHPHQNSARKIRRDEKFAFFRSLKKQSFSSYGRHYLRFLIKAWQINPKMFPEAVRLAIMEYHFSQITDEILAVDALKIYLDQLKEFYQQKLQSVKSAGLKLDEAVKQLLKERDRLLAKAAKMYQKLGKDFQDMAGDLDKLLKEGGENIDALLNDFLVKNYGEALEI